MKDLDGVTGRGAQLGLGEISIPDADLQPGFNLLNGKGIIAAEAKEIASGRLTGYLSGKLKHHLTEGWM